jgi:hypothetical protein
VAEVAEAASVVSEAAVLAEEELAEAGNLEIH